jgi:hydrophobic/amphiphilic exporter-1 (mainly G- bacteria), HAE1 family
MLKEFFRRPSAAIVISFAIMILGILQFQNLPIALYPQTSKPKVSAWLRTGGASALEFKNEYGKDIEAALQAVEDVARVTSEYRNGSVQYTVQYTWGVESREAKSRLQSTLSAFESRFPREWGRFGVWFDGGDSGRVIVSMQSDKYTPDELAELVDSSLLPRLRQIQGMGETFVSRYDEQYVLVTLNPELLTTFGISVSDVTARLRAQEFDVGLGAADFKEGGSYQVLLERRQTNFDELKATVIASRAGRPISLGEVAVVELKEELPARFFKANGQRALILGGEPRPDANISDVCARVLAETKAFASSLGNDVQIIELLNPAKFIDEAVENVLIAVLLGIAITTAVVFLFLGSLRTTAVICVAIPLSLVGAFILMKILGIEINLISLGAMALSVGMVVDGAIVVLENISRHVDERRPSNYSELLETVWKSVEEVRAPLFASLLTTMIVFAPLPFTSPLASAVLGDLAIVTVCVLLVSLGVTLLIIPAFYLWARSFGSMVVEPHGRRGIYVISTIFSGFVAAVQSSYLLTLAKLRKSRIRRVLMLSAIGVALLGSGYLLLAKVRREVMAKPDTDKLFVFLNIKKDGVTVQEAEEILASYEQQVLSEFGGKLTHILSQVNDRNPWLLAFLRDKSEISEVKQAFEARFKSSPLANVYIEDWTPTSLEIPNPPVAKIFVSGRTEADRRELLGKVEEKLSSIEELGNRRSRPRSRQDDYLRVAMKEDAHWLGSTTSGSSLESTISALISGYLTETHVSDLELAGSKVPLRLRLPKEIIKRPGDIEDLFFRIENSVVPLRSVARVNHVRDWADYYAEDGKVVTYVEAWAKESYQGERSVLAGRVRELLQKDSSIDMARLSFADTEEEITENISSLAVALAMAAMLIFIVITVQFGSILQTLLIMMAIPMGFVGVGLALWVFDSTLSVNSMLGLILLAGTAVNNSIIFLDFYNRVRRETSMTVPEALAHTAALRFRPILITTLTTILGMMPLAVAYGSGGAILQPLGIAVTGGLWISTCLILLCLPTLIEFSERSAQWVASRGSLAKRSALGLIVLWLPAISMDDARAASELSLRDAEKIALRDYEGVQAAAKQAEAKRAKSLEVYSQLLPSLTISRIHSSQDVEIESTGASRKVSGSVTEIGFEERIDQPFAWYLQHKMAQDSIAIASLAAEDVRHSHLSNVRKQYFSVLISQRSLLHGEEDLKIAREANEIAKKRLGGGFISTQDARRAEVTVRRAEAELRRRQESLRQRRAELLHLLGAEQNSAVSLSDSLPAKFRFFQFSEVNWQELQRGGASIMLQTAKLVAEYDRRAAQAANLSYLPSLVAGASYQFQNPDADGMIAAGPRVYVGVSWDLMLGGKRLAQSRQTAATAMSSELLLSVQKSREEIGILSLIEELKVLQKNYEAAQLDVEALLAISQESRSRYMRGLISSKDVSDDVQSYIVGQESLLGFAEKIAHTMAELAYKSGKPELFHELL